MKTDVIAHRRSRCCRPAHAPGGRNDRGFCTTLRQILIAADNTTMTNDAWRNCHYPLSISELVAATHFSQGKISLLLLVLSTATENQPTTTIWQLPKTAIRHYKLYKTALSDSNLFDWTSRVQTNSVLLCKLAKHTCLYPIKNSFLEIRYATMLIHFSVI